MRLDCNAQVLDDVELRTFMEWLRTVGVEPVGVFATAVESHPADPPNRYRVHIAKAVPDDDGPMAWDWATNRPKVAYQTVTVEGWSWPFVRASDPAVAPAPPTQ